MTTSNNTDSAAKQVVLSFIDSLNNEDFSAARKLAADDIRFEGVMGSRDGADAYFADMQKMKFKYRVEKAFADGDDICLFYDIDMGGKTIFSCGWYKVADGKIKSFRVIFDPRPLLEQGK